MSLMYSDASSSAPPELRNLRIRCRYHRQLELKEKTTWRKSFSSSSCFRGVFKSVHVLVLFCTFLWVVRCDSIAKAEHVGCGSFGDDRVQGAIVDDVGSGFDAGVKNTEYVCTNAHSFCFLSTLTGNLGEEDEVREVESSTYQSGCPLSLELNQRSSLTSNKSWLPDDGTFEFMNGRTVFCSLSSREGIRGLSSVINQKDFDSSSCGGSKFRLRKNSELTDSKLSGVEPLPHVEVSHSSLDWGRKYLYSPSVVFLTVANTCNDRMLHVYEPFSTNMQFYPCNFSEVLLGPGEVASFCFVFLPRWLGLSSAHLILQTSSGGFVIQAKGYGVESPYGISRLTSMNIPSSGELRRNLSIFNPFNETIVVKELSAWVSLSLGNISHQSEATCSLGNFMASNNLSLLNAKDWLTVQNGQAGFPLLSLRPHENWEVAPNERETIVELDFLFGSEGRIFGAFCMHLLRPSQNESDRIVIPLEAARSGGNDAMDLVSVSLEALPCYSCKTPVVSISLFNGARYMLSVVKISEAGSGAFRIKYTEGLLLFPGSLTQVAVVGCPQPQYELCASEPENCKLVILTNDSSTQIEVPGQDIIYICSRHQKDSSIGYDNDFIGVDDGNQRSGSLEAGIQGYSGRKCPETADADEFVLENWKSHSTTTGFSVIGDQEMIFPVVEVGSHFSKWMIVRNPSDQPVALQLILNSGEIVDECKGTAGFIVQPGSFVPNGIGTSKYGFSLTKTAITEAYLHPHDEAFLGPIVFQPSHRCMWRSSALIRNNLSGVEWFSLQGFGGSISLVLLDEGPETVESIEFNLNFPLPLNTSSSNMLFQTEDTYQVCCQPLTKELSLKNIGDLPLHVKGIKVSGKDCASDGFRVRPCESFSLDPGESTKLQVLYQTDLSGTSVHRDLELALVGGNFVIPMKATLPVYAFTICKKSAFRVWLKKVFAAIFFITSVVLVVLYYMQHQGTTFGSPDDGVFKSKRSVEKSSRMRPTPKFSAAIDVDHLGLVKEGKSLKLEFLERSYDDAGTENVKPVREENLQKAVGNGRPDTVEASEPDKLSVKIGKEKGRRRRKKKGGVAARFEVSSSQSGNSTPSSPLSPVTSVMPDRFWSPPVIGKNPFTQIDGQKPRSIQSSKNNEEQSQMMTRESTAKPAMQPAAISNLTPVSTIIGPRLRAPDSKRYEQNDDVKSEADRYVYDIWGDHLSGLHLFESSKDARKRIGLEGSWSSSSFFVRGPQALMKKSPLQSVS
ncbi:Transmembrane protein 131-like [Linum perenne]